MDDTQTPSTKRSDYIASPVSKDAFMQVLRAIDQSTHGFAQNMGNSMIIALKEDDGNRIVFEMPAAGNLPVGERVEIFSSYNELNYLTGEYSSLNVSADDRAALAALAARIAALWALRSQGDAALVESQIAELAAERKALRLRLRIEVPFVLPIPDPGLLVPLEREAPPALVHQQPAWLVHQQPAAWLAQPGLPARTRSRC